MWKQLVVLLLLSLAGCTQPSDSTESPQTTSSESSSPANPQTDNQSNPEEPKNPGNPASPTPIVENQTTTPEETPTNFQPNVLVGTYDSGLNPYHQAFYRPNRTEHPCTYLQGIPCHIVELNLSIGGDNLNDMMASDKEILDAVNPSTWYWIPKTPFVAIQCDNNIQGAACFLPGDEGESSDHATKTMSALVSESPGVSVAFVGSASYPDYFHDAGIQIDILSNSRGPAVPLPVMNLGVARGPIEDFLLVQSAGNLPLPSLIEGQTAGAEHVLVGGAYDTPAEEAEATKIIDVVSYYCRPLASGWSAIEYVNDCGTSFAAPTVAGALAQALMEVRMATGFTGNTFEGVMDPILPLTIQGLRTAMNQSASYEPAQRFDVPSNAQPVPLNPEAPWLQFGWGFFDGQMSDDLVKGLLGDGFEARPEGAVQYMESIHYFRETYYG